MWFSVLLAVLLVLNSFRINTAKYIEKNESFDKDQMIYEKYVEMDKNLKKLMNNGIKMALPLVIEANEHLNLSSRCVNNLYKLMSEIRKLKLSAIKFLDSSGKLPAGVISGTFQMLGDYDECLNTAVSLPNGAEAFHGQYCMIGLRAVLPTKKRKITLNSGLEELKEYTKNTSELMQFLVDFSRHTYDIVAKYGLCVPSGCSVKDVNKMVNYIGEKLFVNPTVEYCDQPHEFKMSVGTIIAITSFSLAGIFLIVGSLMDYYSRKKRISFKSTTSNIMVCFSVFTNFPKIINTKTQNTVLTSLFGIRTLSVFFIIFLHQYSVWSRVQLNGHGVFVRNQVQTFFGQIINNGFLTTDVFFFLSGLLNTYTRMKIQAEGKRQISMVQIFIHRLWRIYPIYIFTLFLFYLLSNAYGPMATYMREEFFKHCEERWWENLLFINNYSEHFKSCMVHTWYIAADMQLFLISLFTVPVLLKNGKIGIILHVGLLIVGLISTVLWIWHKDVMPGVIVHVLELQDLLRMSNAYATIFPHIAPYCTGLMTGYILSKWNHFKIPVIYRLLGWSAAAACFISMLFMTQKWNLGAPYTALESAFYFGFSRFLYVLAVAWMVICCATGYGGILNYILSLKVWIPFSRISYAVYMISYPLQLYYNASLKMLMDTDRITMIWRHIGDVGISCLLALVLVLLVESPFISMEKIIFRRSPTRKDVPENKDEHTEKAENNVEIIKEIELVNNEKNCFTKL